MKKNGQMLATENKKGQRTFAQQFSPNAQFTSNYTQPQNCRPEKIMFPP